MNTEMKDDGPPTELPVAESAKCIVCGKRFLVGFPGDAVKALGWGEYRCKPCSAIKGQIAELIK